MTHLYLIYGLQDPLSSEIRYIGRSVRGLKRPKEHFFSGAYSKTNTRVGRWVRSSMRLGIRPNIVILHSWSQVSNDEINKAEILFIEHFRNRGHRLVNLTDGGNATLGWVMPQYTKDKIAAKARGKKARLGHKLSEESKQKISESHKKLNKKMPEDHPLRNYQDGSAFRGKQHSEVTKSKLSQLRSIPVIRSDGKIFPSGKAAADYMGVKLCTINHVLTGCNQSCQGYGFAYYSDGVLPPPTPPKTHKRQTIEYNGKKYKSISSAAKELGMPKTTFFRIINRSR